jgi:hypothetical protein
VADRRPVVILRAMAVFAIKDFILGYFLEI